MIDNWSKAHKPCAMEIYGRLLRETPEDAVQILGCVFAALLADLPKAKAVILFDALTALILDRKMPSDDRSSMSS